MDTKEVRARVLTHGGGPRASNARRAPSSRRGGRLGALQVATYGVLAAVALVCGYVESLVPLPIPVPGIKLGLGNVVVLYALVAFGPRPALAIMLAKVCASALLFGNPTIFAYSLAGGLTSFCAMALATRWRGLSVVGVSMVGGVAHMLGQLAVVAFVLAPHVALGYLPVLLLAGLASGLLVGYVGRLALRATGSSSFMKGWRRRLAKDRQAAAGQTTGRQAKDGRETPERGVSGDSH